MKPVYLLAGDIGGTNSRMRLYLDDKEMVKHDYKNKDYIKKKEDGIFESLIIADFLGRLCCEHVPDIASQDIIACLAVAGPVVDNKVTMTNLCGIEVSGDAIKKHAYCNSHPIKVCKLINDFVAQGYGSLLLKDTELQELKSGSLEIRDKMGLKACVGAGTGLGECLLIPNPNKKDDYICCPSEGGHVEWAPRTEVDVELWRYLKEKNVENRVSVEHVVSGTGLASCYEFFARRENKANEEEIAEFRELKSKGEWIAKNAKKCKAAEMTMKTMMTAYGSEVGSMGIKLIPTGGLFVTGKLANENIDWIQGEDSCFMKAYKQKGPASSVLDKVPLFVVKNVELGVLGALRQAKIEAAEYVAPKTGIGGST